MKISLFAIFVTLALGGCTNTKEQYYWGSYEGLIYQMYAQPGKATPEVQIQKLTEDRQKAIARGKPVPPGVNAHLGMMYAASGNLEQALAAFEEEKTAYPESKVLMEGMISRAKGDEE